MRGIEIMVAKRCIHTCRTCPQEVFGEAYGDEDKTLTVENFKRALSNCTKDMEICFCGWAEPFQNRGTTEMILTAVDSGFAVSLYTTLFGVTDADLDALKDVRFRRLGPLGDPASVHLADLDYFKPKQPERVGPMLVRFLAEHPEAAVMAMSTVDPRLAPYLNGRTVPVHGQVSRSGSVEFMPQIYKRGPIKCATCCGPKLDFNVMLPNGDVVLCCCDFKLEHPMGNLFTTPFDQLERNKYLALQQEQDNDMICRRCEWSTPA